jgi:hypothetical protein
MIKIYINSNDKSSDIEQSSLSFSQGVTKVPSTLQFTVKLTPDKTPPALGDTVILEEDSVRLFKGVIVQREDSIISGIARGLILTCKDGLHNFDALLVNKAYADTTVNAVITDIVTNYSTGFTLDIPTSTPAIKSYRFNYEEPSKCLQTIAQQIGWDWYIDPYDVVHFFNRGTETAPFEIDDTGGKAVFNTLSFDSNIVELKNSVFLRGGEYLDAIAEEDALDKYVADGEQVLINLGYKYNSIQVTINGTPLDVGTDFIHDPAEYDVLYNFQEKLLRWREDNKPDEGDIIAVFGNIYIPLIVQAEDTDSVNTYGRREGIKIDKSITSVLEAEAAATAILDEGSEGAAEGSFVTREKGLRAGQLIRINSSIFGVDDVYKINTIAGRISGYETFEYTVQFIKSGNYTFNDIMLDLLGRDKKNLTISDDEVIQRLRKLYDTYGVEDEIWDAYTTTPPYKYVPVTGENTPGKWNFSTWS